MDGTVAVLLACVVGAFLVVQGLRWVCRRWAEIRYNLPDPALTIRPPVVRYTGWEPDKFIAGRRRQLHRELARYEARVEAELEALPRLRVAGGRPRT